MEAWGWLKLMIKTRSSGYRSHLRSNFSALKLVAAMGALLIGGGILLDMDRVMAVRDSLNRIAGVAAMAAAAETRPALREGICQKSFERYVWTDTDVSVDELTVDVRESKTGRLATVDYDATVKLVVGRYFGFSEMEISGKIEVQLPRTNVAAIAP
jgi:uncharacterized membrane protein